VHVAGGAPGSQETDLLDPSCIAPGIDAIVLAGGSAFGLEAASGAREYLEEKGRGFRASGTRVPIVPAAVIFDLATGDGSVRPGAREGYSACVASEHPDRREGLVGAGAGATVGKYMGLDKCSAGGLASRSVLADDEISIGALMVANCYGSVIDPQTATTVAGPGGAEDSHGYLASKTTPPSFGATAVGVVVTDTGLSKADAKRVAIMAHDGLARAVSPAHTPYDGDMIFVVSTGDKQMEIARLGAWAAYMVERTIIAAVTKSA